MKFIFWFLLSIFLSIVFTIKYLLMIVFYCLIWNLRLPRAKDFEVEYESDSIFSDKSYTYKSEYHHLWNIN